MRGMKVIVRCFLGEPRICRIWDASDNVIYVSSENGIHRLEMGEEAPVPIGFQREDVFTWKPEFELKVNEWAGSMSQFRWDELRAFSK